jgi:hypothetical protein
MSNEKVCALQLAKASSEKVKTFKASFEGREGFNRAQAVEYRPSTSGHCSFYIANFRNLSVALAEH